MSALHPYLRYAKALIFLENNISELEEITEEYLIDEIEDGLQTFRVQPNSSFDEKDNVLFQFIGEEKGNPTKGVFLAPNIMTNDRSAGKAWKNAKELQKKLGVSTFNSSQNVTMSAVAVA